MMKNSGLIHVVILRPSLQRALRVLCPEEATRLDQSHQGLNGGSSGIMPKSTEMEAMVLMAGCVTVCLLFVFWFWFFGARLSLFFVLQRGFTWFLGAPDTYLQKMGRCFQGLPLRSISRRSSWKDEKIIIDFFFLALLYILRDPLDYRSLFIYLFMHV